MISSKKMSPITRSKVSKSNRPRGRPRIHPEGYKRQRKKSNRPRGRPRIQEDEEHFSPAPRSPILTTNQGKKPRGRPPVHHDIENLSREQSLQVSHNAASRRWRKRKRLEEQKLDTKLRHLEQENKKLKFELSRLTKSMILVQKMEKCEYCKEDSQAQFLSLFRLQRVTKVLNSKKQIWRPWSSDPSSCAVASQFKN